MGGEGGRVRLISSVFLNFKSSIQFVSEKNEISLGSLPKYRDPIDYRKHVSGLHSHSKSISRTRTLLQARFFNRCTRYYCHLDIF